MNERENAIAKIDMEVGEFQGDKYGEVIYKPVAEALKQFCSNQRFATAILDSDKTLSDCCKAITKGVKEAISDIEVYRRAVQFYFEGADVKFDMRIILDAENADVDNAVDSVDNSPAESNSTPNSGADDSIISIFDIL